MRAYLDGRGELYEVLIVDDGSSDGTLAMSRTIAGEWPQLQVLALEHNTGKGAAVRLGMLSAKGEHRVFSDADLSTPIEEVERLRARLQGNCAVAIASRALPDSRIDVHQPGRREVMGRTYNRLLRLAALRGLTTPSAGSKHLPPRRRWPASRHCARSASVSTPRCSFALAGLAGPSRKCRCAGSTKRIPV